MPSKDTSHLTQPRKKRIKLTNIIQTKVQKEKKNIWGKEKHEICETISYGLISVQFESQKKRVKMREEMFEERVVENFPKIIKHKTTVAKSWESQENLKK